MDNSDFDLRIFSYLPNPRIWKATIAARLCGVKLDIRASSPKELQNWLWDFDARLLSESEKQQQQSNAQQSKRGFSAQLFKTAAFLQAHPFGTVPAAFSPDGLTGIFESNSIMRAVARLGNEHYPVYGTDAYSAARIDSFLDTSLVFARDSQIYLLSLASNEVTADIHASVKDSFSIYLTGMERALAPSRSFLVGDDVTLADICLVAELSLFSREAMYPALLAEKKLDPLFDDATRAEYPAVFTHYDKLIQHEAFAPDVVPYLADLKEKITLARR